MKSNASAIPAKEFALQDGVVQTTFKEYLGDLYHVNNARPLPWRPNSGNYLSLNDNDMLEAINRMSSGKAVGVDSLADSNLKAILRTNNSVRNKLRIQFESWLNGDSCIPSYLKVARTFFLSKEDSPFP